MKKPIILLFIQSSFSYTYNFHLITLCSRQADQDIKRAVHVRYQVAISPCIASIGKYSDVHIHDIATDSKWN